MPRRRVHDRQPATRRAAQRRADSRVITAAVELFGTHGVSGTSLQMIDLGGGDHDLVLGLELVYIRRLRHPDRVGDHLQRRAAHAVVGEELDRSRDDASLRLALRRHVV